jgi:hypothetical protein
MGKKFRQKCLLVTGILSLALLLNLIPARWSKVESSSNLVLNHKTGEAYQDNPIMKRDWNNSIIAKCSFHSKEISDSSENKNLAHEFMEITPLILLIVLGIPLLIAGFMIYLSARSMN